VFGLSMDYEVFLLSRIREEYVRTGDNTTSTIHGITTTGRVITSAALIMIAVFVSFSLADDPTAKMFGLGLATAVLVDATIVRLVLVPALMKLLGDANWWMPAWFNRRLVTGVGVIGDRNRDRNGQRRRPTGPTGESNRATVLPDNAGTAVELKSGRSAVRDRP
jgi:putative drug exporter of the RND superfamily